MEINELLFVGMKFRTPELLKLEPQFWVPCVDNLGHSRSTSLFSLGQPFFVTGVIDRGNGSYRFWGGHVCGCWPSYDNSFRTCWAPETAAEESLGPVGRSCTSITINDTDLKKSPGTKAFWDNSKMKGRGCHDILEEEVYPSWEAIGDCQTCPDPYVWCLHLSRKSRAQSLEMINRIPYLWKRQGRPVWGGGANTSFGSINEHCLGGAGRSKGRLL